MSRIDYFKEKPELIAKLRNLTAEQKDFKLDGKLRALVELSIPGQRLRLLHRSSCPGGAGLGGGSTAAGHAAGLG